MVGSLREMVHAGLLPFVKIGIRLACALFMMPSMDSATRPMPQVPTILDIEASGFGRNSYPIEIGYALPSGQTFCTLVRPEPQWLHWDPEAENMHGISRQSLLERGRTATEVALLLNEALKGMTVYSDGWANDYSWLGSLFEAATIRPSFRLENLRALLQDNEAEQWHDIKALIAGERGMQRHRASADARMLQLTLQRLRRQDIRPSRA